MTSSAIASALDRLCKTVEADPSRARARLAPATATLLDGLTCRVSGPSGEATDTDMPRAMGGGGSCPSPGWLFRAALAACCASVIAMQAARLGIELTTLAVTVEGDGDIRGLLGVDDGLSTGHSAIRTDVRISARNATAAQLEGLVQWASEHSPVASTVRNAPTNTLRIVELCAQPAM